VNIINNYRRNLNSRKITLGSVILYVLLTLLVFICLYPFLNVIAYSLSGYNAVLSGKVTFYPINFNLAAYKQILGRMQIWISMRTTVYVTLMGTATSLLFTLMAAYVLSRDYLPGKKIFSGLILFTMYFGGGMIPTFLVVKGVGLFDSLGALFIPQAISVFNFIVMRTFFRELPSSLQEAAKIDGASEMQVLIRIVLPLSLPIIATMALFYAVGYWNSYFDALLYIQDPNKYTLQLRLRSLLFGEELNNSGRSNNLEGIGTQVMTQSLKMATVAVSTIPILLVYPWLQKYFVKGVMLGSIKG
jgi:putative aldouronate transport system permease protein